LNACVERDDLLDVGQASFGEEFSWAVDAVWVEETVLDRLTHHVHILEMNGDSFRLKTSRKKKDPGPQ
jgi:DNA replication protein DnaC